jgi:hypothetical protein
VTLIARQASNKVTYPQGKQLSKNVLVIAAGLTVTNRLEALIPGRSGNYYGEFGIIPSGLKEKLRQVQAPRKHD